MHACTLLLSLALNLSCELSTCSFSKFSVNYDFVLDSCSSIIIVMLVEGEGGRIILNEDPSFEKKESFLLDRKTLA